MCDTALSRRRYGFESRMAFEFLSGQTGLALRSPRSYGSCPALESERERLCCQFVGEITTCSSMQVPVNGTDVPIEDGLERGRLLKGASQAGCIRSRRIHTSTVAEGRRKVSLRSSDRRPRDRLRRRRRRRRSRGCGEARIEERELEAGGLISYCFCAGATQANGRAQGCGSGSVAHCRRRS